MAEDYGPPGLVAMTEQECWDLPEKATTGRIAMPHDGRTWIIPVDHVVDVTTVVLRVPGGHPGRRHHGTDGNTVYGTDLT